MNDQRRKRLEDTWDETALELLMDDYAKIAGIELYDEYCSNLETGSVDDIPAELDESCQKMIYASFATESKSKKNHLNTALSHVCKAAMVVLAIFGATTVLVVSVDALRVPILNFFLTQEERYTIISHSADPSEVSTQENTSNIRRYIPKDYDVVYEKYYEQGYYNLQYKDQEGHVISIRTGEGALQLYADTEGAISEKIEVNGNPALLIRKNGLRLILLKKDKTSILDFYAESMIERDFLKIAVLICDI